MPLCRTATDLKKDLPPVTKFDDRLGTLLDDMKRLSCLDDRDLPSSAATVQVREFASTPNPRLSDEQVEL